MQDKSIRRAATIAVFLAFVVVMLGAYTRLTDAGLGCPDWPGCYGHMVLPHDEPILDKAQASYPDLPIEARKAWTEMIHRYVAGTLALLIVFLGFSVLSRRIQKEKLPWRLPVVLLGLVVFQAALGMWTVTLKLLPIVVMGHLLGGMLIVACLARFRVQISSIRGTDLPTWRLGMRLALLLVLLQIALGGWVSSNYAGIACIGFPQCNGLWWPELHWHDSFNLWSAVGVNYQGGALDNEARITIQWVHRLGAVCIAFYLCVLSLLLIWKKPSIALTRAAYLLIILMLTQLTLGVMNVMYLLPIQIAVAHNGVAALLLALVFCMMHLMKEGTVNES